MLHHKTTTIPAAHTDNSFINNVYIFSWNNVFF